MRISPERLTEQINNNNVASVTRLNAWETVIELKKSFIFFPKKRLIYTSTLPQSAQQLYKHA